MRNAHEKRIVESIEEDTTAKVKQEENCEHEGTFDNKEDKMERKEITIPVFDGKDYSIWKKRITMYLKINKCDVVITRAKVAVDKDNWDESDLKAINLIYSAISNKQLEFVCEEDAAYKITKKLDDMYLKESTHYKLCVKINWKK